MTDIGPTPTNQPLAASTTNTSAGMVLSLTEFIIIIIELLTLYCYYFCYCCYYYRS